MIQVTTANICGNPLRPKRAVRKRMKRALHIAGVTFGQEVARSNRWRTNNYSEMWHNQANNVNKNTFGGPHEVPISVPDAVEVTEHDTVLVHKGRARVTPARYYTLAIAAVDGKMVVFINCHTISKPYLSAWRRSHWKMYIDEIKVEVDRFHKQGYTVVVGGDMNSKRVPILHPSQRLLIHSGLDHLWVVPAVGVSVLNVTTKKISRTVLMDHPILTATFGLK